MNTNHLQDLQLAQETCDELRSGNHEAILGIYKKYHPFFLNYTRKKLPYSDNARAVSILDDFWVELLNAAAICSFKGLSSLKNYLFKILKFRIVDNRRKDSCQNSDSKNISAKEYDMDDFGSDEQSPEKDLLHKEKIKLIHESLMLLTDKSPEDAHLVKMYLEGLNYRQMAQKQLGNTHYTETDLDKKVNALKKRFTRQDTGSLARFKSYLERCMTKNRLAFADILN
jgi:RNA polymerase sigma factor (sigma-70 family)